MQKLIPIVVSAVLGVLLAVIWLVVRAEPHEYSGTVYSNPDPAPGFTLTTDSGQRGSLADHRGDLVLVYFGYTYCPDICPASLAELATALATLNPDDRDRVQVVMISVDPARDTPDVLAAYMDHFDPSFIGYTGDENEIATVAADYNVFYQAHEGTPATGYLVDHWSGVYLIDRDGRLVASFGFGTPGEDIAADLEQWL